MAQRLFDRLRGALRQLRVLGRKRSVEAELDEELRFHLEMETERRMQGGMSEQEARRAARLDFGGIERSKEEVREARWVQPIEILSADLGRGVRLLLHQPGFSIAVIVVLALGIGGTTAVFSVVRSVLLDPLPYERPGQLVRIYQYDHEAPEEDLYVSAPHFLELRQRASSFESLAAVYTYHEVAMDLRSGGGTRRITVLPVSAGYFELLRTPLSRGRGFERSAEAGEKVALVRQRLWRDAGLERLGEKIVLDGEPYPVVGVVPEAFVGPLDARGGEVEAWVPQNLRLGAMTLNPGNHFLSVIGRLAPTATLETARQEVTAVDAALAEVYPEAADDAHHRLVPLHEDLVSGARPALLVVLGAVVLVLLVACVNLAGLLLVRALARQEEVAVRRALGAGTRRLAVQLLTEGSVLAAAGALFGVGLALAGLELVRRLGRDAIPRASEISLDGSILLLAAALAIATSLVAGFLPAWRLARTSALRALGRSRQFGDRRSTRLRRMLAAGQIALALSLLVGATALGHTVHRLGSADLGFETRGVLTFQLNLPAQRYDKELREATHRRVLESLEALPGMRAAAATTVLPATGKFYNWGTKVTEGPLAGTEEGYVGADQRVVAGDYFATLGIPILEGRGLGAGDRGDPTDGEPAVAVISTSLARKLFPGTSPLGQVILAGGRPRRIVGVAGDVAGDSQGSPAYFVYHAHAQFDSRPSTLEYLLAIDGDAEAVLPRVRSEVAQIDPELVVHRPNALRDVVVRGWSDRRFAFAITGSFAVLALTLAAIGLYGVLAYEVRQRRREIGIRQAMGASPLRVAAGVLHDGMRLTLAGAALGIVGSYALGRLVSTLVSGTEPSEPLALGVALAVLLAAAAGASLLPAWRALRTPPTESLQES